MNASLAREEEEGRGEWEGGEEEDWALLPHGCIAAAGFTEGQG